MPAGSRDDAWLTRERLLVIALMIVSALVVVLCYLIAAPFLPALTWALALTVIAYPLHDRVARRIHQRSIAAGLTVLIVSVTIIAPAVLVVRAVVQEAAQYLDKGDVVEEIQDAAVETASGNPTLRPMVRWLQREVDLGDQFSALSQLLIGGTGRVVSVTLYVVVTLLLTLYLLFFFVRDRHWLLNGVRQVLPLWARETSHIFKRVDETIHAIVFGTLTVSIIQGTLGGLMFWWLGVPAAMLWGFVMAVLAIVPALGTAVILVPAAIYLALQGDWQKAAMLTAWGTLVVGMVDNLLYPVLVKGRLRLHTVPVFISILGGLLLFGAAGLVLGPVVLAVAGALLDIWRQRLAFGSAETPAPVPPVPPMPPSAAPEPAAASPPAKVGG